MWGQHAQIAGWGLAVLFGISLVSPQPTNAAPGTEIKLPPLRVRVGEKAPDFALPAAGGKNVRLSDFSGRNVLIDFFRGYW
jgi:cytochrome oxidase Cu insertion factor (SCO1/SenC/PrrC family)